MKKEQAFKILAASSAAIALQGCVAAIVPIAAGGLMTQSRGDETADVPEQTETAESVPAQASAATTPTPSPVPEPSPEVQAAIAESAAEAEAQANVEVAPEPEVAPPTPEAVPEPEPEPEAPAIEEVAAAAEQEPAQPAQTDRVSEAPAPSVIEAPTTTDLPDIASEFDEPAPEAPAPVLVASLPEEPAESAPAPAPVLVASLPEEPAPPAAPEIEAATDLSASQETPTKLAMAEIETPVAEPVAAPVPAQAPAAPAPAPSSAPIAPSRSPSPIVATLFDPLVSYATAPEFAAGQEGRNSAMLRDATSLRPTRIDCAGEVPTVLIDLDPDGEDLDLSRPLSAPSALGVKLAQMRAQGIAIAWISRESRDAEAAVRAALTRSGLDLSGGDQLLLMGDPDDRKQTLRDGLAGTSCLVAIAGDTRSDFHELFDYLLNPDDAFSLQPMIGNGWFIIPTPLLPERP